ncbi:MAG TPA: helix-turn-helix domain-containing protein [Solirubrobacteraceae bacterium]|jgi:excisionase family DNA binding protein|nr:helix-turn-helix domain-containing protein [Solirubrobacteraceae bacterium]
MAENMYSAEEAAQLLGLQVRTVRNYVREGRLPGVRIGKQYRIARADLEAFTAGGFTQQALLGSDPPSQQPLLTQPAAEVSSVVQIDGIDALSRDRIERTLAAAVIADADPALRVEPLYDEERGRLKLIIVASAGQTVELLRIVDALVTDRRS